MSPKLILAGGGHAHMTCLAHLERFVHEGIDVTVIGPAEHHYYSGMGPGMLGGFYRPEEIRFNTRRLVEKNGGTFVTGKVAGIDPDRQTVEMTDGSSLPYDVLSCNLGSHVPDDIVSGDLADVYLVKPIERLVAARRRIEALAARRAVTIGIVGGGPSAVEIAGNLWGLTRRAGGRPADIHVLVNSSLMPHHPEQVRGKILQSFEKRGIVVIENLMVKNIRTGGVVDANGKRFEFDVVFVAVGVTPTPVFRRSGIPTGPDGGMRVNRRLQSPRYPNIFGGGDCIHFDASPLDKVGVYAVRQNPILYNNLMAALQGRPLEEFRPQSGYLLIFNLGDGTGVFRKGWLQFNGRLAFRIKDHIDRRFMRTFQAAEA